MGHKWIDKIGHIGGGVGGGGQPSAVLRQEACIAGDGVNWAGVLAIVLLLLLLLL